MSDIRITRALTGDGREIEPSLYALNYGRILAVAALCLALQVLRLFTGALQEPWYMVAGFWFQCALAAAALCLLPAFRKQIIDQPPRARLLYLGFWLLLITSMIPCLIHDIRMAQENHRIRPFYTLFLSWLLSAMPIFSQRQTLSIFLTLLGTHFLLCLLLLAPLSYFLSGMVILLIGLTIAYLFQAQLFRLISKLKQEASIDPLTGIMNRKGGLSKVHTVIELSRRYGGTIALYMVDIDFFKIYNDGFGHVEGDYALRAVATALSTVFARDSDVVCRYGGEEFVICALADGRRDPGTMAQALCTAVENLRIPTPDGQPGDYLSISVGFTVFKPEKENAHVNEVMLIELADRALYHAKSSGRNATAYQPAEEAQLRTCRGMGEGT